jgi:hypothetical protein
MIRREQIEELLKMPVDEHRRVLQLLQASLTGDKTETPLVNGGQTFTCCQSGCFRWRDAIWVAQGTRQLALMKFCVPDRQEAAFDNLFMAVLLACSAGYLKHFSWLIVLEVSGWGAEFEQSSKCGVEEYDMNVQSYARIAGVLFLLSMVAGGFGEAYIPSKLIVSGDATATAANLRNFDFLYRLGFASFLIESLCDTALALILYVLLKPVNKQLSLLAAFFGLMGTATFAFAELFYFAPQLILGRPYLNTFTPDQVNSLALLSLKFYGYAGMLFTAYYGMGWIVRSYLIFRSSYLPKFLGVLMAIGGIGFVVRNFLLILAPAYASNVLLMLMFPGGLIMTVWLLVKGIDLQKWNAKVNAARES